MQDDVGLVPADELEELERLLGVDDPVAVAEVVHRRRFDEEPLRLGERAGGGEAAGDAHRRVVVLGFDGRHEITVAPVAGGPRRSVTGRLGKGSETLHEGDCPIIAPALDRPRETVDGGGHGVPDPPLLAWQGVLEADPGDVGGRGVVAQETNGVASDLTDVVRLDPAAKTGPESLTFFRSGRFGDGDGDLAVVDADGMAGHVLLAHHALAGVDPELPVVPLACQQLTLEGAGHEAVALVGAGVVEGMDTRGGADHRNTALADGGHPHLPDLEVVQRAHRDRGRAGAGAGGRAHHSHGRGRAIGCRRRLGTVDPCRR